MKQLLNPAHRNRRALGWIAALAFGLTACVYLARWAPARALRTRARGHDQAALAALRLGDEGGAESEWLQAITLWPQDETAYSMLGDFYQAHGEPEVAGIAYLQLLHVAPRHSHVYCRLAQVAGEGGSDPAARQYAERELERDANCVRALDLLAIKDRQAGERQKARDEADRAYRAAPDDLQAVITCAESLLPEEPERAATILLKARQQLPNAWILAYDLGYCYAHGAGGPGADSQALRELRLAEGMNPQAGVVHRELCRLLLQQRDLESAVLEGALAVRYSPLEAKGYLYYQESLVRSGRKAEAGRVLARFKTLQAAREKRAVLQQRYGKFPADPSTAHDMATVDEQLGRTAEALQVLEEALRAHPKDKQIQQELARLWSKTHAPRVETGPVPGLPGGPAGTLLLP